MISLLILFVLLFALLGVGVALTWQLLTLIPRASWPLALALAACVFAIWHVGVAA